MTKSDNVIIYNIQYIKIIKMNIYIYISHCVILKYTLSKHIHINRQHSDKSRRGYSYQLSFRHPACRTHTGVSTNISAGKQWTVHIVYIYATDPNNRTQYTISKYSII